MNIRSKFALGLIAILLVNLGIGLYGLYSCRQTAILGATIHEQSSAIVTTALIGQVHFKKQVQEWKNILLRGADADLYAKYRRQFEDQERLTREASTRLAGLLAAAGEDSAGVQQFVDAHTRLGQQYRSALDSFRPLNANAQQRVDRAVRGIDREPSDLIDQVVQVVLNHKQARLAQVDAICREGWLTTFLSMVALMTAAVLFFIWLVDRNIGRPIATATAIARRVSAGDYSSPIAIRGRDETAQMLAALQTMQHNLSESRVSLEAARDVLQEERGLLAQRVIERTAEIDLANIQLARNARAKDEFLAAMSHELRTPLTSILGLSETLEDGMLGDLSNAQRKATHTIHENGTHLLDLINDVLDMSKVTSGKMKLHWDQIPASQLWDASLRLIQPTAEAKKLRVTSHIDSAVQLLRGDSRRLKQILINLLGNAVKFTAENGTIGLDVNGDLHAGKVRVCVWDTGVGIPEDQQQRLFKPFVQLDNRLSRRHNGTGLGLALSYAMAELHDGTIELFSEPGKGSRFELVLPWDVKAQNVADVPKESDTHEPEAPPDLPTPRTEPHGQPIVLLVDGNRDNLDMVATYLQLKGFQVQPAATGAEAIAAAVRCPPYIVLMDVQMPGMDGLETTRHLRGIPALEFTPIVAFSALAMPGDKERCLEAGMDDYLVKPMGLKELQRNVMSWIGRTTQEDPSRR